VEPRPRVVRVGDGIPHRVDRLRALGNAVVPQVAEWIGRQIIITHRGDKHVISE
jgi:DNA (cytosine-5)-methyltransferase 1